MTELLNLYLWTIPAGAIFGAALALLGCQIAARERVVQTFCVSQGAIVGVLIALGMGTLLDHSDPEFHAVPLLASVLTSTLVFAVSEFFAKQERTSKSTVFASIFTFLLACSYLISVVFPALERHMANVFFGDLATLTEFDSKITLVLGGVTLLGLIQFWKPVSNRSFEIAIYGETATGGRKRQEFLYLGLTLILLCYAVQFLGFLFTMTLLFLPTTILTGVAQKGLRLHLALCIAVALISVAAGFLLSLYFTQLPTVPMVTVAVVISALTLVLLSHLWRRFRGETRL
ncbi:MAG: metal ABC transporter permease [Candidatus Manganitrophus sp.]|nr:MAG: metal ABC transporter permease [Candidatus Manganitrophus sp.]